MEKRNSGVRRSTQQEEVQLVPLIKKCFGALRQFWYWFVISAIACMVLGYIYQQRQNRVYMRQAVILIEDSEASGSTSTYTKRSRNNATSAMMGLGGITIGDNLKNEMFILSSVRLMTRVVDALNLNTSYMTGSGLHDIDLYKDRPFTVTFKDAPKKPATMEVEVQGNEVKLSAFKLGKTESGKSIKAPFGEYVSTPIGTLCVSKEPALNDFEKGKKVKVDYLPTQIAAQMYKGHISATEYDKEASLIVLSVNDINTQRAEDLLMGVYEAYQQDIVENKNIVAQSTADFIDERIALIGRELNEVEDHLTDIKSQSKVIDMRSSAANYASETAEARKRTLEMSTQLSMAEYLSDWLAQNSTTHEAIPTVPGLGGTTLVPQIQEYNRIMFERNRNAENTSETSAVIREFDRNLSQLRGAILATLRSYKHTVELQLRDARSAEGMLNSELASLPAQERVALDVARQKELKEALYTYLLNKREEVALQLAISKANVRMVEEPLGPAGPSSPRTKVIMLIALLIGLIIPALVIWLRELFDTKITNRTDIEEYTSIPVAGSLPRWEEAGEKALISEANPTDPVVEAFRLLRHGLQFLNREARTIVITSATPGQGKSFTSRNLAYILGTAGKRVVLIDADIRKRTVSHMLGQSDGLTGYLASERENLDHLIVKDAISGVDFLPAGVMPPNPAELLLSDRLEDLNKELLERYDYVIYDTTPFLGVADAGIVDRLADITLFVLRIGVQRRDFLPQLEKMYQSEQFKGLCAVVNDCDMHKRTYGYGYGNGYGYGYGYGYGDKKKK